MRLLKVINTVPEKSANCKAQNQQGIHSIHWTDLCFAICSFFFQVVFIMSPLETSHTFSFSFSIPVVFGSAF